MRQYLIIGSAAAVLLLSLVLLWPRHSPDVSTTASSEPTRQSLELSGPSNVAFTGTTGRLTADSPPRFVGTGGKAQPNFEKYPDVRIIFYGLVVDQDSNTIPGVKVDAEILQWDLSELPDANLKITHAEGESGADGRFEVSGVNGHSLTVRGFRKEGYEPEFLRGDYGEYNPQGGSLAQPIVFRLWNTNLHEELITGDSYVKVIPDGRRYGIDLAKGKFTEGESGDLIVWIQRSESVAFPQQYAWSCGMYARDGGFERETNPSPVYRAPLGDYTNTFTFSMEHGSRSWTFQSRENRLYVRFKKGSRYGRILADFWPVYAKGGAEDPTFGHIHLSYAINPSGSRVLR